MSVQHSNRKTQARARVDILHPVSYTHTRAYVEDGNTSHPLFLLREINSKGELLSEFAVVTLSVRRAEELLAHLEELKAFVEDYGGS